MPKHQLTILETRTTYDRPALRDGFYVTPRRLARECLRRELRQAAAHLKKAREVALIVTGPSWIEQYDIAAGEVA